MRAFRDGAYREAEDAFSTALLPAKNKSAPLLNVDWVTFLLGESAFYSGHVPKAREAFEKVSRNKASRFAAVATARIADCLWTEGDHARAVEQYRKLPVRPVAMIDAAVGRYRVALFSEEQHRPDSARLFLSVYRDFPAHPLAAEAQRHIPATLIASSDKASSAPTPTPTPVAPIDRLKRAETLTHDRNWQLALDELALLPADLAPPLSTERDYQIGMTKFHMRRDYAKAAELLLGAAPALTGDKAASALFHGTRALSRVDRDDEAIAGYKQVVAKYATSRFAPEAQFLSGWLDYNRGRYRESLPGLKATLDHYGKSAFADDAAWCLAFAHYLLGDIPEASRALDRYAAMPPTGMTGEERSARVAYWRARFLATSTGASRSGADAAYREVNRRFPFTFYGVAARARLAEGGQRVGVEWAPATPEKATTKPRAGGDKTASKSGSESDVWAKVRELAAAGLDAEAGWELERGEKQAIGRSGNVLPLLTSYTELKNFHRAYELAESHNGGALSRAPTGAARIWWEAAYPRAYREWVDPVAAKAGNPDLFLFAIMRKESGFFPWDVSYADARGLLQMIPPTSSQVARELGIAFEADDLYQPETNIRLGAAYIGGLAKKFHGQIPLLAGAYNAGPKAMAKWCDQHGNHAMDEFV